MIHRFGHYRVSPGSAAAMVLLLLISVVAARAEVKIPAAFSDHMVLQHGIKIPIWGWADPGEEVSVTFGGQQAGTRADAQGNWRVDLGPVEVNAVPQTPTVQGDNAIHFEDVLVGDVWVCSGQSNMGVYLEEAYNAQEEVPKAHDSLMRLFTVREESSIDVRKDVVTPFGKKWQVAEPKVAAQFSAVGYFFGRELRRKLGIPIGLARCIAGRGRRGGSASPSLPSRPMEAVTFPI